MAQPILLGIPYDASSSYLRGAAAAPPLVRAAVHSPATNTWSELAVDVAAAGGLLDAGDLHPGTARDMRDVVDEHITRLATTSRVPISVGGDHSITYPIVTAISRAREPFALLHIDAHPDLYDELEGDRHSHASPFARIMEARMVTRLVQVGIRAMTGHQREQAERFGVDVIDMRRWTRGDRPAVNGPVYVSIDLDGIDPAFAPGVSHREPGGLSVRDVITLIHDLPGPLVGADIVEFNPSQDVTGTTVWVAAKLVKELAGVCLLRQA